MLSCFLMVHLGHELSEFRIELHCPGTAGRMGKPSTAGRMDEAEFILSMS